MRNLTLNDSTQRTIAEHLAVTERLLAQAASEVSGRNEVAEIIMLPDLGMPHNVTRVRGGFFTGAYYSWSSTCPLVPIDATVNVDSVSIYRVQEIASQAEFLERIALAESAFRNGRGKSQASSYHWNFAVGNHFITYGFSEGCEAMQAGGYLVLHSSASEYKHQHNGLYPIEGNWYWKGVKVVEDKSSGRYLRYIDGSLAQQFIELAHSLVQHNSLRHRHVASLVAGEVNILEEVLSVPHYGMPNDRSVAIGCQWVEQGALIPLLTGPGRPILLLRTGIGKNNIVKSNELSLVLHPHGLGKQSKSQLALAWTFDGIELNGRNVKSSQSLECDTTLELRDFFANCSPDIVPQGIVDILAQCPSTIIGRITPVYSYARKSKLQLE